MTETTTEQTCTTHKAHLPSPLYVELHHVIPQAWQAHWQPPQPWPNQGPSPDRTNPDRSPYVLWDARKIPLCRTGHGNVHVYLVEAMHFLADLTTMATLTEQQIVQLFVQVKRAHRVAKTSGHEGILAETAISAQAILRYVEAGGDPFDLAANHLWGQI